MFFIAARKSLRSPLATPAARYQSRMEDIWFRIRPAFRRSHFSQNDLSRNVVLPPVSPVALPAPSRPPGRARPDAMGQLSRCLRKVLCYNSNSRATGAEVAELADALDLGASVGNHVGVQIPPFGTSLRSSSQRYYPDFEASARQAIRLRSMFATGSRGYRATAGRDATPKPRRLAVDHWARGVGGQSRRRLSRHSPEATVFTFPQGAKADISTAQAGSRTGVGRRLSIKATRTVSRLERAR